MTDNWKTIAENQKKYLLKIIQKIESGEDLNNLDYGFIIGALKLAEKSIPLVKPKPLGHPRRIENRSELIMQYAIHRRCGLTQTSACEKLGEQYDVSYEAILKIIKDKKYKKEIDNAVAFFSTAKMGREKVVT